MVVVLVVCLCVCLGKGGIPSLSTTRGTRQKKKHGVYMHLKAQFLCVCVCDRQST